MSSLGEWPQIDDVDVPVRSANCFMFNFLVINIFALKMAVYVVGLITKSK